MFKVALVGTHGVNKTTLAYELAGVLKRRGKTVELLTEIARECPFPLNEQGTTEAYQWIIARQVQILVCDRAVLDNFAYYVRRFDCLTEECEALRAYCYAWMKGYDLLVRLPITRHLTADGFRSTDETFQRHIDAICDDLFESVYTAETRPAYLRGAFDASQIADFILQMSQFAVSV